MEPTNWLWVTLGVSLVAALLWWARSSKNEYKGSDPGRRFSANEVDRLLSSINARRPKPAILNPKRP